MVLKLSIMVAKQSKDKKKNDSKTIVSVFGIWKYYQWAILIFPMLLMVSHWCIFYVFSQNTQELLQYSDQNVICIAWIYVFLFLVLPLITLPASFLYGGGNFFRVPFIYFIFINVERVYYGAWFCTNEMIDTHYILIYCIVCIYIIDVTEVCIKHRSGLKDIFIHLIKASILFKCKEKKGDLYNEIMLKMEGRK